MASTSDKTKDAFSGKRKQTPPQTLFRDFLTAHTSILSRSTAGEKLPSGVRQDDDVKSSKVSSLSQTDPRLQSEGIAELDSAQYSHMRGQNEENIAGLRLTEKDVPLKTFAPRQSSAAGESRAPFSAVPFGFGDFSGAELTRCMTPTASTVSDMSTSHSEIPLLKSRVQKDVDPASFPGIGQPLHKVNSGQVTYVHPPRHSSKKPLSSDPSSVVQGDTGNGKDACAQIHNRDHEGCDSQSAEPHATHESGEKIPEADAETHRYEQDWETVASTNSVNSAESSSTGAQQPLPWSPLQPVRAVTDLASLRRQEQLLSTTGDDLESSEQTSIGHDIRPGTAVTSPESSITALPSLVVGATQIRPTEHPEFHTQTSSSQSQSLHRSSFSLALKSSSLFPTNPVAASNTSSSSSDKLFLSQPSKMDKPKMDKGKGRARDEGTNQHEQVSASRAEELELPYEAMFEEIHYEPDDRQRFHLQGIENQEITDNSVSIQNLTSPIWVKTGEPSNSYGVDAHQQTVSQNPDQSTNASMLPKALEKYNPDFDPDVSAFLRDTAHVNLPHKRVRASGLKRDVDGNQPAKTSHTKQKSSSQPATRAVKFGKGLFSFGKKTEGPYKFSNAGSSIEGLIDERLSQVNLPFSGPEEHRGRPAPTTAGSRRSLGRGAGGFTGVTTADGSRIGVPERVILFEDNLPADNTFSYVGRLPALKHNECTEIAVRERLGLANDDWARLGHECPQFPLREGHLEMPHPIKSGRRRCERLQKLEGGAWLEQAYCSYHQRAEFSATPGLMAACPSWEVAPAWVAGGCLVLLAAFGFCLWAILRW